jgi:6,7-dimethyl-8-ribityllumazine synthase
MGTYGGSQNLRAVGIRVGIVASRYNHEITSALVESASQTYLERGGHKDYLNVAWVPGSFELPFVVRRFGKSHSVDAVVAFGAVIEGETPHHAYIAAECARGIQTVALEVDIPIIFGVLTLNNIEQAYDRIKGGKRGDKGVEAMETAIEMVQLLRSLPGGNDSNVNWIRAGQ